MTDDAALVVAARAGDREAFAPLVDRWFDRCWEVAWRILHDRDLAADVAQDTLLLAWRRLASLERPESFGGWVLRIARNRALDRLARERRARPTDDHADLEPTVRTHDPSGPEAAVTRAAQQDLVWAAAAALGERDTSLLDLHLRHGLEPAELADELGIAPNAAHQAMFRLRQRLGDAIRAWLLWRHADPECVVLRAELAAAAGGDAFDAATLRLIRRHVKTCDACADEQQRVAAPAMLFSAVPLVLAPAAARADALRALADAGVPVDLDGRPGGDGGAGGSDGAAGGGDADGGARGGDGGAGEGSVAASTPSASPAMLPVVRGGSGARWTPLRSTVGSVPLVVVALVLGLLASAGGWAWSRSHTEPAAGVSEQPTLPAVAPTERVTSLSPAEVVPVPRLPQPRRPSGSGGPEAPAEREDPTPPPDAGPEEPPPPDPDRSEPQQPVASPPEIVAFRVAYVGACATAQQSLAPRRRSAARFVEPGSAKFQLSWDSRGGESATLSGPAGTDTAQPSGTALHCAQDGSTFTLTVVGPGGSASQSVIADAPDPVQ